MHQWQPKIGWQPVPQITVEQLLPGVRGVNQRSGWIHTATPNLRGVAWIATLAPWGSEVPQRSAFVGQVDVVADLYVHHISLEPMKKRWLGKWKVMVGCY